MIQTVTSSPNVGSNWQTTMINWLWMLHPNPNPNPILCPVKGWKHGFTPKIIWLFHKPNIIPYNAMKKTLPEDIIFFLFICNKLWSFILIIKTYKEGYSI